MPWLFAIRTPPPAGPRLSARRRLPARPRHRPPPLRDGGGAASRCSGLRSLPASGGPRRGGRAIPEGGASPNIPACDRPTPAHWNRCAVGRIEWPISRPAIVRPRRSWPGSRNFLGAPCRPAAGGAVQKAAIPGRPRRRRDRPRRYASRAEGPPPPPPPPPPPAGRADAGQQAGGPLFKAHGSGLRAAPAQKLPPLAQCRRWQGHLRADADRGAARRACLPAPRAGSRHRRN